MTGFPRYRNICISSIAAFASFIIHYLYFSSVQFPVGGDAYVYLVQIRSLIEDHRLHYADLSLVYPLFAAIYLLVKNYIASYVFGISFLCAFFTFSVFSFSRKSTFLSMLPLMLWSILSPSVMFIASQFPKNFLALSFFILMIAALRAQKKFPFIIFFICSLITHRLSAIMSLGFCAIHILFKKRKRSFIIAALAGAAALLTVLSFLPGTLHPLDAERFKGLLSSDAQFAPFSFLSIIGIDTIHPIFAGEIILSFIIIVSIVIITVVRKSERIPSYIFPTTVICIAPLFPFFIFNTQAAIYRLYFSSVILSFLFLPYIFRSSVRQIIITSIIITGAGIFCLFTQRPQAYSPPYPVYRNIAAECGRILNRENPELIIAHRPLAETIDYYEKRDALAWKPETRFNRKRVWRIVYDIELDEIKDKLPEGMRNSTFIKPLSARYILAREDAWEIFSAAVSAEKNGDRYERTFSEYNPFRVRPAFMTRGHSE